MEIIFDIVIIAILLISIYWGYKKGLVNVGFNLFALIVSLAVSIILYRPITDLVINNTEIDENIEAIILLNGTKEVDDSNENMEINEYIQNYAQNLVQEAQNTAVQTVSRGIAASVVGICVMIALFVVTRIILICLKSFTNIITKIPIIKQCNEVAGIIYGALRGLIVVYVILAIVFFLIPIIGDFSINSAIENSYATKFFYNNNIILKLIQL